MTNTTETQRLFNDKYGAVSSFDQLFGTLTTHITARVPQQATRIQSTSNRLLGLSWNISHILDHSLHLPHDAIKSVDHYSHIVNQKYYDINKDNVYVGTVWLRFEHEVVEGSCFPSIFHGSMINLFAGGYSTYQGPWQQHGRKINDLEHGVPWTIRQPLAAYAYNCYFYVNDFPSIDEHAVMLKLQDASLPKSATNHWAEKGLDKRDRDYILRLKQYRKNNIFENNT